MYGKLREANFRRHVKVTGECRVKKFNVELDAQSAYRLKQDGTLEDRRTFSLKPGETYMVTTDVTMDVGKLVMEGQIHPDLASKAQVTLSHTRLTPADKGPQPVTLVVSPVLPLNIVELPWAVRYFTEFSAYPTWDQ